MLLVLLVGMYADASAIGLKADSKANSSKKIDAPNDKLRSFTVADSIAMRRLQNAFVSKQFNYSPDGRYIAMVTQAGNLVADTNDYQLVLYKTDNLLDFINAGKINASSKQLDEGRVLVEFASATNGDGLASGIRRVRWLSDNRTIAFVSEQGKGVAQVFSVDIHTGEVKQLTDHPRSVVTFDINLSAEKIIYIADVPMYYQGRGQSHYTVDLNIIRSLVNIDEPIKGMKFRYYVRDIGQREESVQTLGEPFFTMPFFDNIWLSPNGNLAIGERSVTRIPAEWRQYPAFANLHEDNVSLIDENTMAFLATSFSEFVLIDLDVATVEPIIGAPNGRAVNGQTEVAWLDNKTVILGNTFLPLAVDLTEIERKRRQQSTATVEVDIKNRHITRIMDHSANQSYPHKGIRVNNDGSLAITLIQGTREGFNKKEVFYFKKHGNIWKIQSRKERNSRRLALSMKQGLNTAPEVLAHDTVTGNERVITNLNPQFMHMTFGHVKELQWTDSEQRLWLGGVVYPVGYQLGKVYPLVVQTHGFIQGQFLVEGPARLAGAYAAQALANKGLFVLQLPDKREGKGTSREREIHLLGIESAIDTLSDKGLIDADNVGIMGFSRSGHYVQHAITFSEHRFTAATIADALSLSTAGYTTFFGHGPPGMSLIEQQFGGAVPWGERLQEWVAQNPVYHLDRVQTPLRLEQYTGMLHWWDIYTILRRQQKPVEWVVVAPDNHGVKVHNLIRSRDRYVIQQGNVDWFTFWLKGEEDPDPAKAEQYQRWRKLRQQQKGSEVAANAARKRSQKKDVVYCGFH